MYPSKEGVQHLPRKSIVLYPCLCTVLYCVQYCILACALIGQCTGTDRGVHRPVSTQAPRRDCAQALSSWCHDLRDGDVDDGDAVALRILGGCRLILALENANELDCRPSKKSKKRKEKKGGWEGGLEARRGRLRLEGPSR